MGSMQSRGRWQAGIAFLVLVGIVACSSQAPRHTDLPTQIEPRLEGFSPAAEEQIRSLYRTAVGHPYDPDANGRLGMALHAYEQFDQAEAYYRRAAALATDSFRWTYYLACVEETLGKTRDAVQTFSSALGLRQADLATHLRLAELLSDVGETDRAAELLTGLTQRHERTPGLHYRLGQLVAARNPAVAVKHFSRVVELDPQHREGHYALAQAYRQLGDITRSKAHLSRYEKVEAKVRRDYADPLIDEVDQLRTATAQDYFEQGLRLEEKRELHEASAAYLAALAEMPTYVQAHVNLIGVYGQIGDLGRAEQHYKRSIAINPAMEEAHYNFGVLALSNGEFLSAVEAFEKALATNPHSPDTHSNLGTALEQLKRPLEAERHYRLALENQPNHRAANYHLGRYLAVRRQYREAIGYLEKAISPEDDKTPQFLHFLGLVYERAGNHQKASHATRQARDLAARFGQAELVRAIDGHSSR